MIESEPNNCASRGPEFISCDFSCTSCFLHCLRVHYSCRLDNADIGDPGVRHLVKGIKARKKLLLLDILGNSLHGEGHRLLGESPLTCLAFKLNPEDEATRSCSRQ